MMVNRQSQWSAGAIALAGLLVTVAIFWLVRQSELASFQARLESDVSQGANTITNKVDGSLLVVTTLGNYFAASKDVTREEFAAFTRPLLQERREIKAVSWNPRLFRQQRKAFERQARHELAPGFSIYQLGAKGQRVGAELRDCYYPVWYIEPVAENSRAIGFDVGSDPVRLAALEKAQDTGRPTATERILLVQEGTPKYSVLVFYPLFAQGRPAATAVERRRALQGFAVAVLNIEKLLAAAFGPTTAFGLDFELVDLSASADRQLLYRWTSRLKSGGSWKARLLPSPPTVMTGFARCGRQWGVRFTPSRQYMETNYPVAYWLLLPAGALLSLLLGQYFSVLYSQRRQLEEEVLARTAQLQASEASLRELNAHLEERVDERTRELEAANRAKSDFLASMSHEIRTPMNAIVGMADLLSETALDPEQREYVNIFQSAGENLLAIINDILDISKVESGQFELEEVPFDLGETVGRTCQIMALRAHKKGLELSCRITDGVPAALKGDPLRLRQVLINLIGNAVKFTEQGEVAVEIRQGETALSGGKTELVFSVTDTGIGIPADKHEAIFERFTQVDSSTSRRYGGTGLGLNISRRIVELMGGRVEVRSEPGRGSTFTFSALFEVPPQAVEKIAGAKVRLEGLRALVIDDTGTNRVLLKALLEGWGMTATAVEDGGSGLAELERARRAGTPYQLVLLDCRMPQMDGFAVAERIGGSTDLAGVAVIMLTSDNRAGDFARARKLGIGSYVVKPVKRDVLHEALVSVLSASAAAPPRPAPLPAAVRPLRILLADDSEDNRTLILSYLKKHPHQVDTAENGALALEKFKAGRYDLVLMDMQMPVMDGYRATAAIREWESLQGLPRTPLLALTAYALREDTQKSLDAGCDAHLTKPIKKAELLAAIESFMVK